MPAGVGVREVHRRPRRRRLLAPRPLSGVRRGDRVLGAGRDGADAGRHHRGRTPPSGARAKLPERSSSGSSRRGRSAGWVEPRLAQLLGLADRTAPGSRDDLFAAWRLFFERHRRAEPGRPRLRGHPVGRRSAARLHRLPARLVAQPSDVRGHAGAARALRATPGWGSRSAASRRCLWSRSPPARWTRFWPAWSPGLPDELRAQISDRADGVPLYAVETVRMLLDRGLVRREGEGLPRRRGGRVARGPRRCTPNRGAAG